MASIDKILWINDAGEVVAAAAVPDAAWSDKRDKDISVYGIGTSNGFVDANYKWHMADDALTLSNNATTLVWIDQNRVNLQDCPGFLLPVKTTTGDPAVPWEGQVYVNTFDNKIRCYADGAWRDLATW
jgi:hypothetical protein